MPSHPPLQTSLPWTTAPLLANAPMGGIAGPSLACAVTSAGGLGLMGMDYTASKLDEWLDEAEDYFSRNPVPLTTTKASSNSSGGDTTASLSYLPIGIGFLVSFSDLSTVSANLSRRAKEGKKPPALFWFFAAKEPVLETYTSWATTLRKVYAPSSPSPIPTSSNQGQDPYTPQIYIQTGGSAHLSLAIALSDARPEVLIVQGQDAGGHGMQRGASIVGLVPEISDLLASTFDAPNSEGRERGLKKPRLLASGGIVDARGVLAALSLGAEGVVMGTRFLASPETAVPHAEYRARVLAARDGGMSTVRAKVFDELRGENEWPVAYDGRALVSESYGGCHSSSMVWL